MSEYVTIANLDPRIEELIDAKMAKHLAERHAKPVEPEPAKTDADWAMEAYLKAYGVPAYSESAAVIREAAERHYASLIEAGKTLAAENAKLLQERDAEAARSKDKTDRITQLQGYLLALADVLGASYPSPMTDATFAANIMAATKKTIQECDAARAESKLYKAELEKAAERLQRTHWCGEYKAVGLREVAAATEQVCDELDAARAECERLQAENRLVIAQRDLSRATLKRFCKIVKPKKREGDA